MFGFGHPFARNAHAALGAFVGGGRKFAKFEELREVGDGGVGDVDLKGLELERGVCGSGHGGEIGTRVLIVD